MLKHRIKVNRLECGTDEAGRGCLAGPVTAAAVILPKDFKHQFLNDSKQLSKKKRELLRHVIEKEAICFAVAHIYPEEIDDINILNASILGMHKAIEKLEPTPEFISVDGNKFKAFKKVEHECFVKGDSRFLNIAAASVLAKTYRDEYMLKLHLKYPEYKWNKNKGYPTKEHRLAIEKFGPNENHRKSFKLLPQQLRLQI